MIGNFDRYKNYVIDIKIIQILILLLRRKLYEIV